MRIEEIIDLQEIEDLQALANKSQTDALNRQSKQIKVKRAKLAADRAQQKSTKAQQKLRKVQAKP
jgi:hypothetical protein